MARNGLNINRASCPSSAEVGAHFGVQVSMSMVQVSRPFPHLHQPMLFWPSSFLNPKGSILFRMN